MPRKGENIHKRKDGRWEGRYICERDINGKAKYRSIYGRSYSEVKCRLREINVKGDIAQRQVHNNTVTFGIAARHWLEMRELFLKRSTIVKYSEQLNKHILPAFSHAYLYAISEQAVTEFLKRKSIDLSSSSLRTLLTIIKSVLKHAKQQGWCDTTISDLVLPSTSVKKPNVLESAERQRLVDFLFIDMDRSKLGIYLCLYTGLRIGELCALRWSDINFEKGTLTVSSTIQRLPTNKAGAKSKTELYISAPKSSSSIRTIPLPDQLISMLKYFRDMEHIFLLTGAETPIDPRSMQYTFKKYAQQLCLSCSNIHALRHTFATNCIELGFDAKTLSEILGHSRVDITLNRYVHSSAEHKRAQMELLFSNSGQFSGQNLDGSAQLSQL